jgi:hypothetical protein
MPIGRNQIYLYINQNKGLKEGYFFKKKGIQAPIKYPRGTPSKQIINFNHCHVKKTKHYKKIKTLHCAQWSQTLHYVQWSDLDDKLFEDI